MAPRVSSPGSEQKDPTTGFGKGPWKFRRRGLRPQTRAPKYGPRRQNNYIMLLPNLITSASLFLALYSITKSSEGIVLAAQGLSAQASFVAACWAILLAAVCDAIDGPVARLTRSTSDFGLQYDSLADMTAFGLAPAFLMFARLRAMDPASLPIYAPRLALGACSLYAICSAIRLARFNTQAGTKEKGAFLGLPSPGAAGTVVTAYLFVEWLASASSPINLSEWNTNLGLHRALLLLMVALAVLMVSEIPFPKLRFLMAMPANPIHALVGIVVIACVMIAFNDFLPAILFMLFVIYLGYSVVMALTGKLKNDDPRLDIED